MFTITQILGKINLSLPVQKMYFFSSHNNEAIPIKKNFGGIKNKLLNRQL